MRIPRTRFAPVAVTRREALKMGGAAGIGLLSAPGLTDKLLSAPLEGQGGAVTFPA